MTTPNFPKVLFLQHAVKPGGAVRSMQQIIQEYELEAGPQTVLFLRNGPAMENYSELQSKMLSGKFLLPFHGSTVSGMNWKMAFRNLFGTLLVPYAWLRWLRHYDVVYLNSSALCVYGWMLKRLSPKVRVICHIREPLTDDFWGKFIRKTLARGADHVIAISHNELDNLGLHGQVVYNYVLSKDYKPARGQSLHRQDATVPSTAYTVGYFARLDLKNGLGDFIALARRFEHAPEVVFCVYGHTGKEGREVNDALAKAGENVRTYPMVSDVPPNLCDLDVLLVPFKTPHFSRSVVEAAMLSIPSIIYDIPSVNETVLDGQTGYVVPLGDLNAMAERLEGLRNAPEKSQQLGDAAHDFAMNKFSERNFTRIQDVICGEV